jgi:hypothetical protein
MLALRSKMLKIKDLNVEQQVAHKHALAIRALLTKVYRMHSRKPSSQEIQGQKFEVSKK